jgi:hypothetical protein
MVVLTKTRTSVSITTNCPELSESKVKDAIFNMNATALQGCNEAIIITHR